MIIFFWVSVFIVVYTYIGYGFVLFILVKLKQMFVKPFEFRKIENLPYVTLMVAAYNEEELILEKLDNTLKLNYPNDKLQIIFITDGSTDRTYELLKGNKRILLLHEDKRAGKMAAIERAIPYVNGEITIFTDANTFLNEAAIVELVKHYQNPKVGAVAGEKKILVNETADASSAGEGFYWKYESFLKRMDYALYSNVGAAGELFSVRTALYQPIEHDTIIDDHMIAMRIAERGYVIGYEPLAYATETASENIREELKRKVRICAGGIQSILRLKKAANPFVNPVFTFQYISHRVLRWTITPFLLVAIFLINPIIILSTHYATYEIIFLLQLMFYILSLIGLYFESKSIRIKILFVPYYFCVMNYAVIAGMVKFYKKNQSAAWEKSKRKVTIVN